MKPNEIRAALVLRNITNASIAKHVGVQRTHVSMVIHGVRSTARIRRAIAEAVGKTVSEIWP